MASLSRTVINTIVALGLGCVTAAACPRINGLRDYNSCDSRVVLAFVGDSLTYGVGDPTASTTTGGYPGFVGKRLPNTEIRKYAVPGLNAMQLWRYLHRPEVQSTMSDIDYAIVTVGTNNYWRRTPHMEVVRRIARIVKFVRSFGAIASAATVPPTLRETPQKAYLEALNSAILNNIFPKVRFDTLPVDSKYFVSDKLHMTRAGYRNMANIARQYFTISAQTTAAVLHPDTDGDGLDDVFETGLFGTDPHRADTDGDGVSDGEEIALGRNPLIAG